MAAHQNHIDMDIDDALIEKPYCFAIDDDGHRSHFYLYPATLGKLHILRRHIEGLGIDAEALTRDPFTETLRLATDKKEQSCRILAYHTIRDKEQLFDFEAVEQRTSYFKLHLTHEELATMLIHLLTAGNVEAYKRHLGITKEGDRARRVAELKRQGQKAQSEVTFGGKSVYGALIDVACERYGWTYDYVLWGISATNLQLILADRVQTMFLTDDDRRRIPSGLTNQETDVINADDKANRGRILSMDWR